MTNKRIDDNPYYSFQGNSAPYRNELEHDFLVYQTFKDGVKKVEVNTYTSSVKPPPPKNILDCTDYMIMREVSGSGLFDSCRPLIVRVCSEKEWRSRWRETSDEYKKMKRFCQKNEYHFRIFDESRIRHKAFRNVEYLLRHTEHAYDPYIQTILDQVEIMGVTTIEYLLSRFFGQGSQREHGSRTILHLMATKQLGFDAWGDLNEKMEVWYVA